MHILCRIALPWRIAGAFVLLMGWAGAVSAGEAPPSSARRLARAKARLAAGDASGAVRILRSGTEVSLVRDREALLLAHGLRRLNRPTEARVAYAKAMERTPIPSVRMEALRGLVNVAAELGDRPAQLESLEALLALPAVPRRTALRFQRAQLLADLGRSKEAVEVDQALLEKTRDARFARRVATHLRALARRGAKVPVLRGRVRLAKARGLIRRGRFDRADAILDRLQGQAHLARDVALVRAELHRRRGDAPGEASALVALEKKGLDDRSGPIALWRLGRLALERDDEPEARRRFTALAERYPDANRSAEGEFLLGWMAYDAGDFRSGARQLLDVANKRSSHADRDSTLWFAGWSAYLAGDVPLVEQAFRSLIEKHPDSSLVPGAHYWLGRTYQRSGQEERARTELRRAVEVSPLGYYGFFARARLRALEDEVPDPRVRIPRLPRSTAGIVRLFEEPPLLVLRAVALFDAGLEGEAIEELSLQAEACTGPRDKALVAELLRRFDARDLAYRVASRAVRDAREADLEDAPTKRAFGIAYPKRFLRAVRRASRAHRVDPALVLAIIRTESAFNENARSPVGARGLMQLMPSTARRIGGSARARRHARRFTRPSSNVWLGSWYFAQLLDRYRGQGALALGAYNAGPNAMDRWVEAHGDMEIDEFVERIPYRETRRYVRRALESYLVYRALAGRGSPRLLGPAAAQNKSAGF